MSFKKSVILAELQQAIKRKVTEKSKHKDQINKVLLSSVEKKRTIITSTATKDRRESCEPGSSGKPAREQKIKSLFNNESLFGIDFDPRSRKHNNRKLDKIIALINYVISSSEKVAKFINTANFEAEFAVKLYRSDKDNLLNQLRTLSVEDIIDSQRSSQRPSSKIDQEGLIRLQEQNTRLRKEILLFEKQAEKAHLQNSRSKQPNQFQIRKYKESLKKILSDEEYLRLTCLVQKEAKFQAMMSKYSNNSKKVEQIEQIRRSIEIERKATLEGVKHGQQSNIRQIQEDKQELEREVARLQIKVQSIGASSQLLAENQSLRSNHELLYKRLNEIVQTIYLQTPSTNPQHSQNILECIKVKIDRLNEANRTNIQKIETQNQQLRVSETKREKKQQEYLQMSQLLEELSCELRNKNEEVNQLMQVTPRVQTEAQTEEMEAITNLQEQLEKTKKDCARLIEETQKRSLIEANELEQKLTNKLTALQQMERQKQELSQSVLQMKEQLLQTKGNLQCISLQLIQLTSTHRLTEVTLHAVQKQQQKQEKQLQIALSRLASKEEDLHNTQEQLTKTDELLSSLREELTAVKQELHQTQGELRKQLASQPTILPSKNLRQEIEVLNEYLRTMKEDIRNLQEANDDLEDQVMKQECACLNLRTEREILKQQLEQTKYLSQKSNETNKEVLAKLEKSNLELHQSHSQIQSAYSLLQNSHQQLQHSNLQLQNTYSQLQNQHSQLQRTYSELKNGIETPSTPSKQAQLLKLQQIQHSHSQLQTAYSQLQSTQLLLQNNYCLLEQSYAQLNRKHSQLEASNSKLKSSHSSFQNAHSELQASYSQLKQTYSKLKQFQSQLQETKSKLIHKHSEQSNLLNLQLLQLNATIGDLRSSYTTLEKSYNQLLAEVHCLKSENEALRVKHEKMVFAHQSAAQAAREEEVALYSTKQQQYCYLVKQILKVVIDGSEMKGINDLQELLEFGSKRVLELRKKQREQQSVKRKQDYERRNEQECDQDTQITDFSREDSSRVLFIEEKQKVITQLIAEMPIKSSPEEDKMKTDHLMEKTVEKMVGQSENDQSGEKQEERVDIGQFLEVGDTMNDSVSSNTDHFQDFQNQMMRSNLQSQPANNLDFNQFEECRSQELNQSDLSQIDDFQNLQTNLNDSMLSDQKNEDKDQLNLSQFGELAENLDASLISKTGKEEIAIPNVEKDELNLSQFGELEQNLDASLISDTGINRGLAPNVEKDELNLSQFGELAQNLDASLVSDTGNEEIAINLAQKEEKDGLNFSQFGELGQNLDTSQISEIGKEQDVHLSQFGSCNQEENGSLMTGQADLNLSQISDIHPLGNSNTFSND